MTYKVKDRFKEWTTYAGVVTAALAAAVPQVFPAASPLWAHLWQSAQLFLGGAMVFIPQTAGSTAVENEAWTLLKSFAGQLPAGYADSMQPLIATLAASLARAQTGASAAAVPAQAAAPRVVAQPTVPGPTNPAAPAPSWPQQPAPLAPHANQ